MKKQILMLSALAMLMVTSCSKSKEEPKEETSKCQLTETSTNGKTTYTYNSDGKLASAKEGDYQETYTYASNTLIWKFIEPSGSTSTTTYTLDAQGMVKTSTDGAFNSSFSYDVNGYLSEVSGDALWVGTIKYTWTNGNLTKIEQTRNGSTITTSLAYNTESRLEDILKVATRFFLKWPLYTAQSGQSVSFKSDQSTDFKCI